MEHALIMSTGARSLHGLLMLPRDWFFFRLFTLLWQMFVCRQSLYWQCEHCSLRKLLHLIWYVFSFSCCCSQNNEYKFLFTNFRIIMSPNINYRLPEEIFEMNPVDPMQVQPESEESYEIAEVSSDGSINIPSVVINEFYVNFTWHLSIALQLMPPMVEYIGCINCMHPITLKENIIETINAVQHSRVAIAHVVPFQPNSDIAINTVVGELSNIHWHTQVQCCNCNIELSIPALTIFNSMIDEYSSDLDCIILDASSVGVFIKINV